VGTEAAVETAALAAASAAQAVLGKRQALAVAKARITRAETGRARQDIRLKDTRRRLADTALYAEFDGISGSVTAIKGGRISANEKLGRLIDPAALEVAFRLSNGQFLRLVSGNNSPLGREVQVRLEILGADMVAEGRIERIGAEVGEGQTGRLVFAELSGGKASGFRSGDFVSVEVDEPPLENTVTLPATAVDSAGRLLVLGEGERLEELTAEVLRKQGVQVILSARGIAGREVVEARTPLLGAGIKVNPKRRGGEGAAAIPQEPEMIALSPERRARLVDFVSGNANLPKAAKERLLARLKQERVPAAMVNRIESRMGG
jgi:membrane fusion protein, multidrug efflux system